MFWDPKDNCMKVQTLIIFMPSVSDKFKYSGQDIPKRLHVYLDVAQNGCHPAL
jgi:hypothetical protein